MPIPGGGRYRVKTEPSGVKVRLHFTNAGRVNEAKSLSSGKVHTPAEFAADRKRKEMARGGQVPGAGNTDKVKTLLTPGEFVVRKPIAKKVRPMLEALNRPSLPPEIATRAMRAARFETANAGRGF